MAATTTQLTNSLVSQLQADFNDYNFSAAEHFAWSPPASIIFYVVDESPARLLHELGHALLDHQTYHRDVELLKMEADAWHKAKEVAPNYGVSLSEDDVQDHMDSYRDWLHARSTCPTCSETGVQTNAEHYRCLECATTWRVNEARTCGLKRYAEHKNTP